MAILIVIIVFWVCSYSRRFHFMHVSYPRPLICIQPVNKSVRKANLELASSFPMRLLPIKRLVGLPEAGLGMRPLRIPLQLAREAVLVGLVLEMGPSPTRPPLLAIVRLRIRRVRLRAVSNPRQGSKNISTSTVSIVSWKSIAQQAPEPVTKPSSPLVLMQVM